MNKKNRIKDIEKYYDTQPDLTDFRAVSAHDATGLIPSGPTNPSEIESYEQTYDYRALITDDDVE